MAEAPKNEQDSALRQWARDSAMRLQSAKVNGELDEPVLGPLGRKLKGEANWTDDYPAWQSYADELEMLLEFAKRHKRFESVLGRLQADNRQRDSALMELRVARHLQENGFTVVEWEPPGADGSKGEFVVESQSKERVFVEVKGPGWQGEVTPEQRKSGRLKQPKYIDDPGEGGASDPSGKLLDAIYKAYVEQDKFRDDIPNLLVLADDLFVSLAHLPEVSVAQPLYSRDGCFADRRYERLGGVGIFWFDKNKPMVGYHMRLFLNPNALPATTLPRDMQEAFRGEIVTVDSICAGPPRRESSILGTPIRCTSSLRKPRR
jgi:hypothetical protein